MLAGQREVALDKCAVKKIVVPISLILQLGAMVVTATLLPLLIGIWVDNQLRTAPWITLLGLAGGIILAMVAVYRTIAALNQNLG